MMERLWLVVRTPGAVRWRAGASCTRGAGRGGRDWLYRVVIRPAIRTGYRGWPIVVLAGIGKSRSHTKPEKTRELATAAAAPAPLSVKVGPGMTFNYGPDRQNDERGKKWHERE